MDKQRFSLLLLEPGEIYFEDFSVHFKIAEPDLVKTEDNYQEIGRLKVCSKSLVFDPQDHSRPIIKILLRDCLSISRYEDSHALNAVHRPGYLTIVQGYTPDIPNEGDRSNNVLQVKCDQFVEIFEGNILAPYKFKDTPRTFLFSLNYANVKDCLELILKLHKASKLSMGKQIEEIAVIEMDRQSLVKFNPLWLHPFKEKVVLETIGSKITPLVMNGGRLILTNLTLYYQPFNKIEPYHILKINLSDIKTITKRRFLLQHVGLELNYNKSYLYLSLKSQKDRDHLFKAISSQPAVQLESSEPEVMTLQWQNGFISNYDYLLYLNSLGDRTFNDLTQYPVFPWVISDYISPQLDLSSPRSYRDLKKPIGALNLERLQKLKERYEEMSRPKFLYGSHYSTPGFVLFYLVRKYPHYMLCLQNGKFDHPDRMFNSISDVWKNVQTNMSDFKELVPEFYDVESGGDFLENLKGIQFGYRHDGTRVNDVTLPPWAENRVDFVKKLREALESDYVSANLHHWIDLIFGYKQSGEEAISANNVFFYLCYEGAVDLENITDRNERHSKEVQIMEYGQVPKQLFFCPHPEKRCTSIPRVISSANGGPWPNLEKMTITAELTGHKDFILGIGLSEDSKFIASVGKDATLKIHNSVSATRERNVSLSLLPLSAVLILPSSNNVIAACWDGTLKVYDVECGSIVDVVTAHGDAVSCLCWASTDSLLISGSWDCCVRVWRVKHPYTRIRPASDLVASLDHDDKIAALAVNHSNTLLATGTCDGEIVLWSLKSCSKVKQLEAHKDIVNALQFSPDDTKLVSCSDDQSLKVFDVRTELVVFSKCLVQKLKCLAWDGMTLLVGGAQGSLYLWDLYTVSLVKEFPSRHGGILAMCASVDGRLIVTGGEDKTLRVWR